MAKNNNNASNNANVLKIPNWQQVNPFSKEIKNILNINLKDTNSFKKLKDDISSETHFPLLQEISNSGYPLTFNSFRNDRITLDQLLQGAYPFNARALSHYLQQNDAGKEMEQKIIDEIFLQFYNQLNNSDLQKQFKEECTKNQGLTQFIDSVSEFIRFHPKIQLKKPIEIKYQSFLSIESDTSYTDWTSQQQTLLNNITCRIHLPFLKTELDFFEEKTAQFSQLFSRGIRNSDDINYIYEELKAAKMEIPKDFLNALKNRVKKLTLPDGTVLNIERSEPNLIIDTKDNPNLPNRQKDLLLNAFWRENKDDTKYHLNIATSLGFMLIFFLSIKELSKSNIQAFRDKFPNRNFDKLLNDDEQADIKNKIAYQTEKPYTEDTDADADNAIEDTPDGNGENNEKAKEAEREIFAKHRNNMQGYKFPEDTTNPRKAQGFRKGTRLALKNGDSGLYPQGGNKRDFFEIVDISEQDNSFTVKAYGGERKLPKSEGKTATRYINNFGKKADKLYKLPDPSENEKQPQLLLKKLRESNLPTQLKSFEQLSLDPITGFKKGDQTIQHFGNITDDPSKKFIYNIKYHPGDHSFNVSSEQISVNGGSKYKQRMDFNAFCLFIGEKKLSPFTDKEAEFQKKEYKKPTIVNSKTTNRKLYSIGAIIGGIKNMRKKVVTDKTADTIKKQIEAVDDLLINNPNFYEMLKYIPGYGKFAGEQIRDIHNKREDKRRENIDKYYKEFKADKGFTDTFDQEVPFVKFTYGMKSYKDFLTEPGTLNGEKAYEAAALLLVLFEEGKSPYRGIDDKRGEGLWIKKLLGQTYFEHFERQKKDQIMKIQNGEAPNNQDFVRREMQFIIQNINGDPTGQRGAINERGLPNGKNAKGELKFTRKDIDNPAKIKFGGNFARQLDDAMKKWNSKSTILDSYAKMADDDWDTAYSNFKKFTSGRSPTSIAALMRMGDIVKSDRPDLLKKLEGCMLTTLLSGDLNTYEGKDIRKLIYQLSQYANFLPGLLAEDIDHPDKIRHLLDEATNGHFSAAVILGPNVDKKSLLTNIELFRNSNATNIEEFAQNKLISTNREAEGDPILQEFKTKKLSTKPEKRDYQQRANNDLTSMNADLTTSANIIYNKMSFKDGEFSGADADEKNNKAQFRDKITSHLRRIEGNPTPETLKLVIDAFCERFGVFNKNEFATKLRTLQAYHNAGPSFDNNIPQKGIASPISAGSINENEIKKDLWRSIIAPIYDQKGIPPKEFSDTLGVFFDVIYKNLERLTKNSTVETLFGKSALQEDFYRLAKRDNYMSIVNKDYTDVNFMRNQTEQKKREFQIQRDAYVNSDSFLNKQIHNHIKSLQRKGISVPVDYEIKTKLQDDDFQTELKNMLS
ncbi:hypothetical protein AGMMS50249_0430 [candidate division SR1 bacterium]|nr:hypothetical protein AGMMS50249_0430 [candidate division SR1 bacterium]